MWEYYTAYCHFEHDCKQCKDEQGKKVSHWVLDVGDGEHQYLQPGLNVLGKLGWELVAVQHSVFAGNTSWYFYLFKRQIAG
jgi:hypothetical protein